MKMRLFVWMLCVSFVVIPLAASAARWTMVAQPTSVTLYDLDMKNDVMMAVGGSGTIVVSADGGDTWKSKSSTTNSDLYDIVVLSDTKAVAVGASGVIVRTTDAGSTWTRVTPTGLSSAELGYGLFAAVFPSSNVGYAVGTHALVLKTTNGGSSWTKVTSPDTTGTKTLYGVTAVSTSKLWVVGENGLIAASSNGGSSWSTQSSGTAQDFTSVRFADATHGWATGADRLFLRTTNGSTWSTVTIDELALDEDIYDISFSSSALGILSTGNGSLLETDDGGLTWSTMSVNGFPILNDVYQSAVTNRWGVGGSGVIYRFDSTAPSKVSSFDVEGANDAVTDTTPTFTWTAATDAESAIDSYRFKIDSGFYADIGDTTSTTYDTALEGGAHTASLYAIDEAGNVGATSTLSFTVVSDSSTTASSSPTVSRVSPTTAVRGETITFSARLSDDGTVEACNLYVDGTSKRGMTVKKDVAYATLSFSANGTHSVYARCADDDGLTKNGNAVTVTVNSGSDHVEPGSIVKIGCEGDVQINDPCTAVYYYGVDGKRHAFPNERVFKSWYTDFEDLVILSASAMAEIPLGRNVTFRPGARLVKFSTSTVYAVSYGGLLRPIAGAQIAEAIYGENWIALIESIPDVFFGNYRVGATIHSSADFSPSRAASATRSIDATF